GTHLSSTGLIHDFYITDIKKKELKFVCGISATKLRASIIQELITLSKRLELPLKDSLPHIQEQIMEYRELQKKLTIFTKRNLHTIIILLKDKIINLKESEIFNIGEFHANNKTKTPSIIPLSCFVKNSVIYVFLEAPNASRKELLDVFNLGILSEINKPIIFIILIENQSVLVYCSSPQGSINAKTTIEFLKSKLNTKGGGSPSVAQITAQKINNPLISIHSIIYEENS
ncbi:MAG: hypothetical protein ACXAC7_02780, partial [Candidatus Hodarchaeales archaeon]